MYIDHLLTVLLSLPADKNNAGGLSRIERTCLGLTNGEIKIYMVRAHCTLRCWEPAQVEAMLRSMTKLKGTRHRSASAIPFPAQPLAGLKLPYERDPTAQKSHVETALDRGPTGGHAAARRGWPMAANRPGRGRSGLFVSSKKAGRKQGRGPAGGGSRRAMLQDPGPVRRRRTRRPAPPRPSRLHHSCTGFQVRPFRVHLLNKVHDPKFGSTEWRFGRAFDDWSFWCSPADVKQASVAKVT